MTNKFRFAAAGLLTLRPRADLTVRSDDLLTRLATLEQALAQQKQITSAQTVPQMR